MAKKPVSSKRLPKPAKSSRTPSRPAAKPSKKPAIVANGQGTPSAASSEPRKPAPASEASIRQLDRQILQLINRRAEATTRLIEAAPNRSAAIFDLRGDDLLWQELSTANPGPLPMLAVRGVFRQILS